MTKKAFTSVFALTLALTTGVSGTGEIVSKDRISGPIDSSQVARIKATAHPLAQPQFDKGRIDPGRDLTASLTFRLSPAQQADLSRLLRDQQDRTSPNYHRWLTPEQYAARFGMTANDLTKVSSWLSSQGLRVESVSRNRNEIRFSGSAGQIEYALKTEIHNYSIRGEQHFANAMDISLPAAFSAQVLGVRGLDDFRPHPRFRRASPRFTSSVSGNHFLIPGDFDTIYDIPSKYNGSGQKIAVVGQTNISNTDIDAFRSAAGLAAKDPTVTLVPGTGTLAFFSGDETEADLDLEWSGGIAPAASIVYVTVGNNTNFNVFDSLQYAITQNLAPVISISYGNCEAALGSFVMTAQQWAQEANAQGQTISGPAGDDGAADCDGGATSATQGLAVDVPASIPEVTGVGGTEFSGDAAATVSGSCASPTAYWQTSCSPTSGASAIGPIPETTWNDTVGSLASGQGFAATGGGASSVFGKPSWQTGTGVPNDGKRDVPDVALSGSNGHDPYLICSQDFFSSATSPVTSCASGFRASSANSNYNNTLAAIGGTSADAPTFAAVVALLNQATGSNGLGNINPMLYSLANNGANNAFRDVTSGDNKVPCIAGTTNCSSSVTCSQYSSPCIGFSAGTGYDQVTGLGSLDVGNLVTAWLGASPSPDFALDALVTTIAAPGQQGSSTITVTALNGFTGTVNLSCIGVTTTAQVGCSVNPATVDLSASKTGTSALTITTVAGLTAPSDVPSRGWWLAASGGIFAAVVLAGMPIRRRWVIFSSVIAVALLATAVGCGGGSSSTSQQQQSTGTPAGTYTITITGTSGSTSHSTTVSVKVQ